MHAKWYSGGNKKGNKKQPKWALFNLIIIFGSICITTWFVVDDYKTPLDDAIAGIIVISSLMILCVIWIIGKNDNILSMLAIVVLLILHFIVPLIMATILVYEDDCNQINKINPNISVNDCINFIINNPDSTGMEVIEVFEKEEIKEPIDRTILNRQFNQ